MRENSFGSAEKLKKTSEIELLFKNGRAKTTADLRIVYLKIPKNVVPQKTRVGVSVSKKNFKKAVDRNRIKRLLRECYRHNKDRFSEAFGEGILAMMIWRTNRMPSGREETERIFLELCKNQRQTSQP